MHKSICFEKKIVDDFGFTDSLETIKETTGNFILYLQVVINPLC
jgi:hypothetical protein